MLKKRGKRKLTKIDSLIGQRSRFEGNITFSAGLHIDGTVRGNVVADDADNAVLNVSERGTIEGEVKVPHIHLYGIVNGDVHAYQHIELGPTARVEGNVYYSLIEMAMGAEVNGKLVHLSEQDRAPLALGHENETPNESEPLSPESGTAENT
jgi:cytoskeletal protein CcmA (bactofilin family)